MTDLQHLVRELRSAIVVPHERRLWGLAEIADYSGFSASTVQQRHACLPDFPAAIRVDDGSQPRWVASEVWAWYEGRRRQPKR